MEWPSGETFMRRQLGSLMVSAVHGYDFGQDYRFPFPCEPAQEFRIFPCN